MCSALFVLNGDGKNLFADFTFPSLLFDLKSLLSCDALSLLSVLYFLALLSMMRGGRSRPITGEDSLLFVADLDRRRKALLIFFARLVLGDSAGSFDS